MAKKSKTKVTLRLWPNKNREDIAGYNNPKKKKYYCVSWKEVDYGIKYIAAYSNEEAIEQLYEDSGGNIEDVTASEVNSQEYEENS
jgi:hypothetical protein